MLDLVPHSTRRARTVRPRITHPLFMLELIFGTMMIGRMQSLSELGSMTMMSHDRSRLIYLILVEMTQPLTCIVADWTLI